MLKLKVIEVKQPLGVFYITKIDANSLLKLDKADPYRVLSDGSLSGIQRSERENRLNEIAQYLLGVESAMPNSIIIAGNTEKDLDESLKWSIQSEGKDKYLIIPELIINGSIIDGQHRLKAFNLISVDKREEYELLCSI
jgi:DGQHR domain-containing protein